MEGERKRFAHKKSLGQHFLTSDIVPGWMCDAAEVRAGDAVLEIGPGTGALTKVLLARGASVSAIEADERAIDSLEETFSSEVSSEQLTIMRGDLRELTAAQVADCFGLSDHAYKLVSNIPYYLSGRLFRTFLETPTQPSTIVFLVQQEVAARIARDEKESLLSLSVKLFGNPTYIRTVGRGHFNPPPKVDSAIIKVADVSNPRLNAAEVARFFNLIHRGFAARRKQLRGTLAAAYGRESVTAALAALNLPPTVRAEDVSLEQWLALVHRLSTPAAG